MARNPKFSIVAVNAEVAALGVLCNSGYLRLYNGTKPANAEVAVTTQVLLAELRFAATAFLPPLLGVATANPVTGDATANAPGIVTWFRVLKSDGQQVVYDGTIAQSLIVASVETAVADLLINSTLILSGAAITGAALTLTASRG